MATFLKHVACPNCGSRDNRAIYNDGSEWCFGCGTPKSAKISPYVTESRDDNAEVDIRLPHDASHDYNDPGLSWLLKYELTIPELIKHNVYWSQIKQQVLFAFYESEGVLGAYQARNFSPGSKSKNYNKGDLSTILPIYHHNDHSQSKVLVLVEDPVSAIKISRYSDAMPCLGSSLPTSKINALARLYGAFLVWLDGNMYHNAQKIAMKFELLGSDATVVYTPNDPKDYSDKEIKHLTQGN